jgi:hypothetical protein
MRVRVRNEMDNIKLNLDHQEAIIIKEALDRYYDLEKDVDDINEKTFDCQELKNVCELNDKIMEMYNDLVDKLKDINPY